jgi:hypothetical protein
MNTYLLRKMLNHLAVLIFVNSVYVSLYHINKPSYHVEYDMKLVKQQMQNVLITAAAIGVSFGAISFLIVFSIQWNQNILIVIAGFFISIGMARQVLLLARDRQTSEWGVIEARLERILLGKKLNYDLPVKLHGVKPNSPQVYKYLDESKWELEYQHAITSEDHSGLAFAQHATMHMRDKLQIYDQLLEVQERCGGVNNLVLIAIGTLIWLVS